MNEEHKEKIRQKQREDFAKRKMCVLKDTGKQHNLLSKKKMKSILHNDHQMVDCSVNRTDTNNYSNDKSENIDHFLSNKFDLRISGTNKNNKSNENLKAYVLGSNKGN
ncbi:hypothetical protein PanWU01x14_283510 [Parasponia andersonii]|uniref:Uncharacterized protein n=1 Tax=Parasponia andersonii TaxID=3476 RepID=A0A2P5B0C9_PARAD|nr:hypothetical protein PanWU01x14_283510 [Parasponia andersonii]